uniref:Uncharacterized protein n=1 Tax=Rhizophora mucronata TaxID=61149 RepID=A0A2P2NMT8_RHIMU
MFLCVCVFCNFSTVRPNVLWKDSKRVLGIQFNIM